MSFSIPACLRTSDSVAVLSQVKVRQELVTRFDVTTQGGKEQGVLKDEGRVNNVLFIRHSNAWATAQPPLFLGGGDDEFPPFEQINKVRPPFFFSRAYCFPYKCTFAWHLRLVHFPMRLHGWWTDPPHTAKLRALQTYVTRVKMGKRHSRFSKGSTSGPSPETMFKL